MNPRGERELSVTARRALEAYGGWGLWSGSGRRVEAEVSVRGLAFVLKRRPFFQRAKILMEVDQPRSCLLPIGRLTQRAGCLSEKQVILMNMPEGVHWPPTGEPERVRHHPREFFQGREYWRRFFRWDDLDMAYFANYAFWNYFTLPRLLLRPNIEWTEKRLGSLRAVFPPDVPTHCRVQDFIFDSSSGLLREHNYTANVIGRWARAAHIIQEHREEGGLRFPSRRRVTPRFAGLALPGPVLIDITVHRFRVF